MKRCTLDGCTAKVHARGYCSKHYYRLIRNGTTDAGPQAHLPLFERLQRYIIAGEGNDCWTWGASFNNRGRPQIAVRGSKMLAARAIYLCWFGPFPTDWEIHHRCHNAKCVNPSHLRALSAEDHDKMHGRMIDRRRYQTVEPHYIDPDEEKF